MPCQHKRVAVHMNINGLAFCMDCNTIINTLKLNYPLMVNINFRKDTHDEWKELNKEMEPDLT